MADDKNTDDMTLAEALALQPRDLLNAVAQTLAGEDYCCGGTTAEDGHRCCMTGNARAVFAVIEMHTGLTLAMLEDLAVWQSRPKNLKQNIQN